MRHAGVSPFEAVIGTGLRPMPHRPHRGETPAVRLPRSHVRAARDEGELLDADIVDPCGHWSALPEINYSAHCLFLRALARARSCLFVFTAVRALSLSHNRSISGCIPRR